MTETRVTGSWNSWVTELFCFAACQPVDCDRRLLHFRRPQNCFLQAVAAA